MKKISTLFVINRETGHATIAVNDENLWVLDGEGIATVKFDGIAIAFINGRWYKRFDRKLNKQAQRRYNKWKSGYDRHPFVPTDDEFKVLPEGAIPTQPDPDPMTFHHPHWVPAPLDAPDNKHLAEAVMAMVAESHVPVEGATYELIGPAVQCNPYGLSHHRLIQHGTDLVEDLNTPTRNFHQIKNWLENNHCEGVVFHHPDGRMVKIRRKDMGFDWNTSADPRNQ